MDAGTAGSWRRIEHGCELQKNRDGDSYSANGRGIGLWRYHSEDIRNPGSPKGLAPCYASLQQNAQKTPSWAESNRRRPYKANSGSAHPRALPEGRTVGQMGCNNPTGDAPLSVRPGMAE